MLSDAVEERSTQSEGIAHGYTVLDAVELRAKIFPSGPWSLDALVENGVERTEHSSR